MKVGTPLIARTQFDGPTLKFDFPGLQIGVAEYEAGPTGCTVFAFPGGATAALDIRGGSVGTIMATDGYTDAICFAGGSTYGLEAATGVSAALLAQRQTAHWTKIAVVRGAIIYDFAVRDNIIYPDKALGQSAFLAVRGGVFPLGARGAGRSARVGKGFRFESGEAGGQGGAFRQIGRTKIAVFSVVNAIGAIVDRQGRVVRGHLNRSMGERVHLAADIEAQLQAKEQAKATANSQETPAMTIPQGNTTLTLIVTNQRLAAHDLTQLARQVHSSMSRAIQPLHTLDDGDVLYAVTTNEVENRDLPTTALGVLASELAWDAVLCCWDQG
ncbi:MAG: P1 family peptidase [Abitibacteriaceae bacterium]|nr:P1 family peptidase [Abditibacteriaceae bacterium]MBV9867118.1 P1 family peptidase [Abditibacteriaceae bacterium]